MRRGALLLGLLLLAGLLHSPACARQRKAKKKNEGGPRRSVKPKLPALRRVVDDHVPPDTCNELLGLMGTHANLTKPHYNVANTDVLDIKTLINARQAGDTRALESFKLWWATIQDVTAQAQAQFGDDGIELAPSASLIHRRIANPPGEAPSGGHPPHADNSDPKESVRYSQTGSYKYFLRDGPAADYLVTAIVFLNTAHGDFGFMSDELGRQYQDPTEHSISPEAGKLVFFGSGPENVHAVGPIRPGGPPRFTLNLWFAEKRHAVLSNFPETTALLDELRAEP